MSTFDDAAVFMIVPAYNEGPILQETLTKLEATPYSVVLVDDGSTDNTWQLIQKSTVYGLRHPINLGQGAALQTGMTFALGQGAEAIIHFDADGQHRIEDIAKGLTIIRSGQADIVLGSRFLRASDIQQVPLIKRILLRGAVIVNGIVTGLWLSDAHNGFRILSRTAAQHINLRENRFAHATEILWQIRAHSLTYVEYPTTILYTDYSKAKGQSIFNSINILIDVLLRRIFQ